MRRRSIFLSSFLAVSLVGATASAAPGGDQSGVPAPVRPNFPELPELPDLGDRIESFGPSYDALVDALTGNWETPALGPAATPSLNQFETEALSGDLWLKSFETDEPSLDKAIALNTAMWAASLDDFHSGGISQLDHESITAGLLATRALGNFAANEPALFAQVRASGVGSDASSAAWDDALSSASNQLQNSDSGLLDGCSAGLLTMMATGDASDLDRPGCRPCVATGGYLHSRLDRLFDTGPEGAFAVDTLDSVIPPDEFNQLPSWQREMFESTEQTPLDFQSDRTSCDAAGSATTGSAITNDVFNVFGGTSPWNAGEGSAGPQSDAADPFSLFD